MALGEKTTDEYYRIAHAESAMGLQHKVNSLIEEGFVPLGRAFLLVSARDPATGKEYMDYYQTMVHKNVAANAPK